MNTDQMPTIPQGYRWPNGLVLNRAETEVYNLYQTKIEATADEGIKNSLRHRRRLFIREVAKTAGIK